VSLSLNSWNRSLEKVITRTDERFIDPHMFISILSHVNKLRFELGLILLKLQFHWLFKKICEYNNFLKSINRERQWRGTDRGYRSQRYHNHAYSYHDFVGLVAGRHEEITWEDKHGHYHHDYKAHPKYKYSYGVDDHHTKDHHRQKEHCDGECIYRSILDIL